MGEMNDNIEKRLSQLPVKAIREGEPILYWCGIPPSQKFSFKLRVIHAKFNNVLQNVVKLYPKMRYIKYKDWWMTNQSDLISNSGSSKLSDKGLDLIWRAIDASVEYNITKRNEFIAKNKAIKLANKYALQQKEEDDQKMKNFFKSKKTENEFDKFHWPKSSQRKEDRRTILCAKQQPRFFLPHPK